MSETISDYPRVYQRNGECAHLLAPLASPNSHTMALCGILPRDWLGTGSQREWDRAAALKLCRQCRRKLPWPVQSALQPVPRAGQVR